MHWFPFYTKDWSASVAHMSAAQRGVYLSLLIYQWDNGTVPDCPEQCSRIAGAHPMHDMDWAVVRAKFHVEHGRLVNHKLEDVRQEQRTKQEAASERGKRAAAARHGCKRTADAMPEQSLSRRQVCQSESESESESDTEPDTPVLTVRPTRRAPVGDPPPDNLGALRALAAAERKGGRRSKR
jgi:uncharacterized protein YdaU (DUF1376 family)